MVSVPCSNQFLNQEPGSNDEIKTFAIGKGFKGLLMDKIDVNGPKASPVYAFLKVGVLTNLHVAVALQAQCTYYYIQKSKHHDCMSSLVEK